MTSTLEPQATLTPQQRVDEWLADFEAALAARDIDRAVGKFAVDSFWRDLVSFTWNIKTVEGRDRSPTCSAPASTALIHRASVPVRRDRRR